MLLAVPVIIDADQQNFARVIQYRSWIILLPDLLQSSPCILIPFQLYNQCRIVIPVFRLRHEHEIGKSSTNRQFADGLEVILPCRRKHENYVLKVQTSSCFVLRLSVG